MELNKKNPKNTKMEEGRVTGMETATPVRNTNEQPVKKQLALGKKRKDRERRNRNEQ